MKINLTFECSTLQKFRVSAIIRECILATLRAENIHIPCEINVLVTDNNGIRGINKAYRDIDRHTDVLSFPMFELIPGQPPEDWSDYTDPDTGFCPLGDMAISLEQAISQAKEFGHSTRREIGYLTIHSMLHLLGYDHMDDGPQKKQMRGREEVIAASISRMQRN